MELRCLFMTAVLLGISSGLEVIVSDQLASDVIDTSGSCGKEQGCYWVPTECEHTPSTCDFMLTWVHGKHAVKFELVAKANNPVPWAALGLNDARQMIYLSSKQGKYYYSVYKNAVAGNDCQYLLSGTSVFDCIVNGTNSNEVIVQMSHNSGHKNKVLSNRFIGLVANSTSGSYNGTHITCSYVRLVNINPRYPDSDLVMNLSTPHYVLFGRGPTDGAGVKRMHTNIPFISDQLISFLSYSNVSNDSCGGYVQRPIGIRVHATLMVIAWMVLASLGVVMPRYLKPASSDVDYKLCNSPAWFQIHRLCMVLTFTLTLVGVIVIFWQLQWEFKPPQLHPLLGLIVACLITVNPIIALFRPTPESSRRCLFRYVHGFLGHGVHLLAVVTMFFGVQQRVAHMPYWSKWIVVAFGGWRLLADLVLSTYTTLGDNSSINVSEDRQALLIKSEEVKPRQQHRTTIVVIYVIVTIAMALSLGGTINRQYVSRCS